MQNRGQKEVSKDEITSLRSRVDLLSKQILSAQCQRRMAKRELVRKSRQMREEQKLLRTSTIYGVGPGWDI